MRQLISNPRFLLILPIHLVFLAIFIPATIGKFQNLEGNAAYFTSLFKDTIIMSLPVPGGMTSHVIIIGVLEGLICLLFLMALFRREWLPKTSCLMFTKLGLLTTGIVFIQLGLGMRIAKQYDAAASLFFYFALTHLLAFAVHGFFDKNQE
tara:strand:- start:889 stop:1341 length:453 start_codon:yes stop_codon:yes gene_type:complete